MVTKTITEQRAEVRILPVMIRPGYTATGSSGIFGNTGTDAPDAG